MCTNPCPRTKFSVVFQNVSVFVQEVASFDRLYSHLVRIVLSIISHEFDVQTNFTNRLAGFLPKLSGPSKEYFWKKPSIFTFSIM